MKRIFLHIGLNCNIKFLLQPEFSLVGRIFTLWTPIFTMITEVWSHANRAVVTNNSTVVIEGFMYNYKLKLEMNVRIYTRFTII